MPRVLLVEEGRESDVFEVVEATASVVRVRTPFLFEIGEEMQLRIDGADKRARVRAHAGDDRVTELEILP